jgi:hypothetical protein
MGYALDRYLSQLALELDLEAPPQDKTEVKLILNPTLSITCRELDPGILFFSPLILVPQKNREKVFQHAMEATFLGQGTGGAAIGIDEEEKFMTLKWSLPFDMNYRAFKDALTDFANYVDYWKEELKRKELE